MHLVIFDIETTGLSPETDAIIQIGAVRMRQNQPIPDDTFHSYINPRRPIPPKITELTGISTAHVADAPTIETVIADFSRFAADATLVAHNARFDISFLEANCRRLQLHTRPTQYIDSLHLSRRHWRNERCHTLDALLTRLQIPVPSTRHTALTDSQLLATALPHLLSKSRYLPINNTILPIL